MYMYPCFYEIKFDLIYVYPFTLCPRSVIRLLQSTTCLDRELWKTNIDVVQSYSHGVIIVSVHNCKLGLSPDVCVDVFCRTSVVATCCVVSNGLFVIDDSVSIIIATFVAIHTHVSTVVFTAVILCLTADRYSFVVRRWTAGRRCDAVSLRVVVPPVVL